LLWIHPKQPRFFVLPRRRWKFNVCGAFFISKSNYKILAPDTPQNTVSHGYKVKARTSKSAQVNVGYKQELVCILQLLVILGLKRGSRRAKSKFKEVSL
jgi:hypothetical protein